MKKFLAKFLKRDLNGGDQKKRRIEPKLGQASLSTHHEDTFISSFSEFTTEAHPDELFLDYGDWNNIDAPAGKIPAAKSEQELLTSPLIEPLDKHPDQDFSPDKSKAARPNPPGQNDTSASVFEVYGKIPQCIKCGQTYEGFDKNTKLAFCPACGTRLEPFEEKKTDDSTEKRLTQYPTNARERINKLDNAIYQKEGATGLTDLGLLSDIFKDNINYDIPPNPDIPDDPNNHGELPSDKTDSKKIEGPARDLNFASHEVHPETILVEEPLDNSTLGKPNKLEDETLNLDGTFDQFGDNTDELFEHYSPPNLGRNSDNNRANKWTENPSPTDEIEDWELFLDENLEEPEVNFDTIHYEEVELEDYKIFKYCNKILNKLMHYNLKDQSKTQKILIEIFSDFPFYQSYAAIEHLIASGCQIDEIYDIYQIKLLWLNNPNSWLIRRYDKLEGTWVVNRSPSLKNIMTWKLAKDLSNNYALSELENLICVNWQDEWLNLELGMLDSLNKIPSEFSFYPNYLSCKRVPLPSNVKTW